MTRRLLMSLLLATSLADNACDRGRFDAGDDADIRAVLDRQRDAWNSGDLDGFMDGYSRANVVFTSGGKVRRGWQETLDRYRQKYAGTGAMGTLSFTDVEVRALGADAAVVLGHWRLTDTPNAGHGVFSLVVERTAEGWKVIHDHTSVETTASSITTPAPARP